MMRLMCLGDSRVKPRADRTLACTWIANCPPRIAVKVGVKVPPAVAATMSG